jgi:hypothetical protein
MSIECNWCYWDAAKMCFILNILKKQLALKICTFDEDFLQNLW